MASSIAMIIIQFTHIVRVLPALLFHTSDYIHQYSLICPWKNGSKYCYFKDTLKCSWPHCQRYFSRDHLVFQHLPYSFTWVTQSVLIIYQLVVRNRTRKKKICQKDPWGFIQSISWISNCFVWRLFHWTVWHSCRTVNVSFQTWGRKAPGLGWATFGWQSYITVTFVTLV